MPTFNPFREYFPATYKILFRTCRGRVQVWLGSERTTEGTRRPGRMQVLKTWWCNAHDDMMKCNTQANDMATTATNWTTPGTSVSGRYNTPPLWEDLVSRSRMAPEGQRKRKRRGKTKLLLRPMSETKEPWEVEKFETRWERNNPGSTPLEHGRNRTWTWEDGMNLMKSTTHCLRNYWKNGTMGKKDSRQHFGWEGRQNLTRWESSNENMTLRLNG